MTAIPADAQTLGAKVARPASALDQGAGQSQADLQYWQHVFDEARLQWGGASACVQADAGPGAADVRARPHILAGSPLASQAASAHAHTGVASASSMPSPAVPSAATPPASLEAVVVGGVVLSISSTVSAGSLPRSHAHAADASSSQVLAAGAQGPAAQEGSGALQLTPWLQAHVAQTAGGAWQVLLRSSRPLSATQALAAVADALGMPGMPQGDIASVALNGHRIYTRAGTAGRGIEFELRC
ncbi:MAG: hypothetical protein QM742_10120 [Aquabacterium sp.]